MLGVPKEAGHLFGISKVGPYIPMDWKWQIIIYQKRIGDYKLVYYIFSIKEYIERRIIEPVKFLFLLYFENDIAFAKFEIVWKSK